MNAVRVLLRALPTELVRRRLHRESLPSRKKLGDRYELDLAGFLNGARRSELVHLCGVTGIHPGQAGEMRQRLWAWGAAQERKSMGTAVDPELQPAPSVVGGRLRPRPRPGAGDGVLPSARAARFPESTIWPRPVPVDRLVAPPSSEPVSLDELLARAEGLVGVRLGDRDRDKGFYGQRIAELLGLARSSAAAPDWRGEVELKTLAVVRARSGWRLKDGPALSMRGVDVHSKLRRVLWIVRIDAGEVPGAPVLSWFYQELDPALAHAFERARHLRPKGGKGTTARGWYLRRDFFSACGLLRSLNGP